MSKYIAVSGDLYTPCVPKNDTFIKRILSNFKTEMVIKTMLQFSYKIKTMRNEHGTRSFRIIPAVNVTRSGLTWCGSRAVSN